MCVCVCVCVCVYMYGIYIYVYIYVCVYIYIYIFEKGVVIVKCKVFSDSFFLFFMILFKRASSSLNARCL